MDFESKLTVFDAYFDDLERDLKKIFVEDADAESMINLEILGILLNQFFKVFKFGSIDLTITCDYVLICKYKSTDGNFYDYKLGVNADKLWERESKRTLGAFFQLIIEDYTEYDLKNAQRLFRFINDNGNFLEFVNSNIHFTPQATILKRYRIERTQSFI